MIKEITVNSESHVYIDTFLSPSSLNVPRERQQSWIMDSEEEEIKRKLLNALKSDKSLDDVKVKKKIR